jgi:hypothetical protein
MAFVALAALLALLLLPLTVEALYRQGGKDDGLLFQIGVGSWRGFSVQVPIRQIDQPSKPGILRGLPGRLFSIMLGSPKKPSLEMIVGTTRFLSRYCRLIDLKVALGTGDAASTGVVTGALWGIWGALHPLLPPRCQSRICVQPHFNQRELSLRAQCIFQFKLGHIIFTGLRSFLRYSVQKGAKSFG